MDPNEVLRQILLSAKKAGIQSTAAGFRRINKRMVRFSNNSVTVTNSWVSETPTIYLVSEKKRAACVVEEQNAESVRKAVEELATTMQLTPPGDVEFSFPKGPFRYQPVAGTYDEKIYHAENELIDAVEAGIDAARKEGAIRASGVVTAQTRERHVLTSDGAEGSDRNTEIAMTIRAFVDDDSSGQGITLATNIRGFNPEEAGRTAGRIAKLATNPQPGQPGKYRVVFGPSIMANLLDRVCDAVSAYSVDLGLSFFQGMLKRRIASEVFTLTDNARLDNGPGSTPIDDEAYPTQENRLIKNGILETFLHTSYTAAKQNAQLTGSASFEAAIGGMAPAPHNILLNPGDDSLDSLIDRVHDGLYITNNWYTRFQNYRTGDFSTILRDGVFRIVNGKLAQPVKGLRLSDNMLRIIQSTTALTKERHWIKWWEVSTPTFTPYTLAEGVGITTASK